MANQESPGPGNTLVLVVPGLDNSGPGHWQTAWEETRADCRRVDLGMWDRPHRNTWVNKLNIAIREADRPVVIAAHSLGCVAFAWWAQLERPGPQSRILGALLVAPPDTDFFPLDERLTAFSPTPSQTLPFPSVLVASRNDPYLGIHSARQLARRWGSRFVDAGHLGHINAQSGLGDWPFGQALLDGMLDPARSGTIAAAATPGASGQGVAEAEPAWSRGGFPAG